MAGTYRDIGFTAINLDVGYEARAYCTAHGAGACKYRVEWYNSISFNGPLPLPLLKLLQQ